MGRSRNKVAVGEPAAGSPPIYGVIRVGIKPRSYIGQSLKVILKTNRRQYWEYESNDESKDLFFIIVIRGNPEGNRKTRGVVAQLVERLLCKQNVVGSIPSGSTKQGLLAQLVRASP